MEGHAMKRNRKKTAGLLLAMLLGMVTIFAGAPAAQAAGEVTLFTPYTNISVPPGESINYSVDVINNTGSKQTVSFAVQGAPKNWEYELTSGGWQIKELSVLPNETRTVQFEMNVPLQVEKGEYRFSLVAEGMATLPLTVEVSEQGTYKTELTTEQANMVGPADSTFTFDADLRNRTAEAQLYSLRSGAPRGWTVKFNVGGDNVTSVNVEPNATESIRVEIDPPDQVEAGTYKIPIQAVTSSTSAETELEVVISGTYGLEVSTPSGVLSTDVTADGERTLQLKITNTGSADLQNISLDYAAPVNWEVTFEPANIDALAAGESTTVNATIKADKNAIAGDYVTNITASSPETTAEAQLRVTVKTSLLWGWIGVLIILAVIVGIYYVMRKYGRR
jgi:uncharacterized membrane protein